MATIEINNTIFLCICGAPATMARADGDLPADMDEGMDEDMDGDMDGDMDEDMDEDMDDDCFTVMADQLLAAQFADPYASAVNPDALAALFDGVDDLLAQQGNLGDMGLPALDGSLFPEESDKDAIASMAEPTAADFGAAAAADDEVHSSQRKYDNPSKRTYTNVTAFVSAGFATDAADGFAPNPDALTTYGCPSIGFHHLVHIIMSMSEQQWAELWKQWFLEELHRTTSASFKSKVVAQSFQVLVLSSVRCVQLMKALQLTQLTPIQLKQLIAWRRKNANRNAVRMSTFTERHGGQLFRLQEHVKLKRKHHTPKHHTPEQNRARAAAHAARARARRAAIKAAIQAQRRADDEEQPC